jgi:hypothetical protein
VEQKKFIRKETRILKGIEIIITAITRDIYNNNYKE